MTGGSQATARMLEGHFACGTGIHISSECLDRSYVSKTATHHLLITVPSVGAGPLEPPSFASVAQSDRDAKEQVPETGWGVITDWESLDNGIQVALSARVDRLAFLIELVAVGLLPLSPERTGAIHEVDAWWSLFSMWVEIFTSQDANDRGRTQVGTNTGPIWSWESRSGTRTNASKNTVWPARNAPERLLDHATFEACMKLAAAGEPPPDMWLFIRDARALINSGDYRRAVIDAGTAAELAMTEILDQHLATTEAKLRDALVERSRTLEGRAKLMKELGAASVPTMFKEHLQNPRNSAAHGGHRSSLEGAKKAVAIASDLVQQAEPLFRLLLDS